MTRSRPHHLPTVIASIVIFSGGVAACDSTPGQGDGKYEQACVDWEMSQKGYAEGFATDVCRGLYVQYGGNGGWRNDPAVGAPLTTRTIPGQSASGNAPLPNVPPDNPDVVPPTTPPRGTSAPAETTTTTVALPVNIDASGRLIVSGKYGSGTFDDPYSNPDYPYQIGAWTVNLRKVYYYTTQLAEEYSDLPADGTVDCLQVFATRPGLQPGDGSKLVELLGTIQDMSSRATYTPIPSSAWHGDKFSQTHPIDGHGEFSSSDNTIGGTICFLTSTTQNPSASTRVYFLSLDGRFINP